MENAEQNNRNKVKEIKYTWQYLKTLKRFE